jgi:hypothetical protein
MPTVQCECGERISYSCDYDVDGVICRCGRFVPVAKPGEKGVQVFRSSAPSPRRRVRATLLGAALLIVIAFGLGAIAGVSLNGSRTKQASESVTQAGAQSRAGVDTLDAVWEALPAAESLEVVSPPAAGGSSKSLETRMENLRKIAPYGLRLSKLSPSTEPFGSRSIAERIRIRHNASIMAAKNATIPEIRHYLLAVERISERDVSEVIRSSREFCGDSTESFRPVRNGHEQGSSRRRGLGSLKVVNGTQDDAVVWLSPVGTNEAARKVFVSRHAEATLNRIAAGTYRIRFETGETYLRSTGNLCHFRGASEFNDAVTFEERDVGDRILYDVMQLTLHRVADGNADIRRFGGRAPATSPVD